MADEGFHEIQLGKKQLFFAGMAIALYSVVVFSLGVWVGQDVRRPETEIAGEATADAPADAATEPTKVAPNELDYGARVQSDGKTAAAPETKPIEPPSPPETVAATEVKTAPVPEAKTLPPPTKNAATEKTAPKATPPPPARAGSVILQVGAFNDAATATSLANKLKAKGYAAYAFTATSGPLPHKVRVGPLADKSEADKVSARLKKEEGFSPFITR